MKRIKTINSGRQFDLDKEVNKFLEELEEKKAKVKDIKFSTSGGTYGYQSDMHFGVSFSAMIVYEE